MLEMFLMKGASRNAEDKDGANEIEKGHYNKEHVDGLYVQGKRSQV